MTDDDTQSAPTPAAPAPAPEVASPMPVEPAPPAPASAPVAEQVPIAEPASFIPEVIPKASQSASNAEVESQSVSQPASVSQPTMTSGHKWSIADRVKSVATHARKKDVRLAKIAEYAKTHGYKITNDEIEKLLHVSDATASRYAKILVERGILRGEGKGRGAKYTLPT